MARYSSRRSRRSSGRSRGRSYGRRSFGGARRRQSVRRTRRFGRSRGGRQRVELVIRQQPISPGTNMLLHDQGMARSAGMADQARRARF